MREACEKFVTTPTAAQNCWGGGLSCNPSNPPSPLDLPLLCGGFLDVTIVICDFQQALTAPAAQLERVEII